MSNIVGKPHMLKEVNSSMIMQLLLECGPMSKPKLSKTLSLSLPTVNKIVDELEKEGRIRSVGFTKNRAGRKAELYHINKDLGSIIALYYSGSGYIGRVADITGSTVYETNFKLDTGSLEKALNDTMSAIDKLIAVSSVEIKALGIGVPSAVLPDGTLLGIPKIKAWEGFCLLSALKEKYDMEIYLENDANLSAVGYYYEPLANKLDNIVYIYIGYDCLGSGIIINGKLYKGTANFSGELGFMAPVNGEAPLCDYATEGGYLESQFKKLIYDDTDSIVVNIMTSITANYIAIINPDVIVFAGEAVDESMIDKVKQFIKLYSPKRNIPQIIYDGSTETGMEGLIRTCLNNISTQLQIVQNGGL